MDKQKYSKCKWYRGVDSNNVKGVDQFFSTDKDIAGDYGNITELKLSEFPKNPLVNSDKNALAEEMGYMRDPFNQPIDMPPNQQFDFKAKQYAQSKGHDGIVYHSGSFEAPELHIFPDTSSND